MVGDVGGDVPMSDTKRHGRDLHSADQNASPGQNRGWQNETIPVVTGCRECDERAAEPGMGLALASVGVERGLSTREVLAGYLAEFHAGGHKISDDGGLES